MAFARGPMVAVITGASKGFGRAVAVQLARRAAAHHAQEYGAHGTGAAHTALHLVLVARGEAGLEATRDAALAAAEHRSNYSGARRS